MLKAVILDFDGTVNTSERYYEALVKTSLEVLAERLECSLEEAERMVDDVKRKSLSLTKAVEELGISSTAFYRDLAARLDVGRLLSEDSSIRVLIRTLKGMGLRVAMLTNSGRGLLRMALEAIGCPLEEFDAVVTSDEAEPKPSLEPFNYILSLLKVRPEEAVYVGDRVLGELKPAKQVGLWTVYIGRAEGRFDSLWVDWRAVSIQQLPELLRNAAQL